MTTVPDTACLYARQSKASTKSIGQQFDIGEAESADEGWTIAARYSDKVSASVHARKARDDWPKVLDDIEQRRWTVLWLWESSRGDRDAEAWLRMLSRCKVHRISIRVASDERTYRPWIPGDWKVLASAGVDNQAESDKTSARVRRDVRANAEKGRPHGKIKYGYERVYGINEKGERYLVEQRARPDQAEIVREIVERVGNGHPIITIVADLNDRGVLAPQGGRWGASTVRAIALSPVYVGRREHRVTGEGVTSIYDAVWPGIVKQADHLTAVRILSDPARTTTRPGRQKHLLSYLAKCDVCGGHMHRVPMRARVAREDRYQCERGHTGIQAAGLDEFVTAAVCHRFADGGLELRAGDDSAVLAARAEEAELLRQLEEWRESARRRETTPASLAYIEAGLSADIAAVRRKAVTATVPAAAAELLDAGDKYEAVRARWDAMPVPTRREVLRFVVEIRVSRHADGKAARHGFDFRRLGSSRWLEGRDLRPWREM